MPQLAEPWNIIKSVYGHKCIKCVIFNFLLAATWHYPCFWKLLPCNNSKCFYILGSDASNDVKGWCVFIGIAETEKNRSYWWSKEVLINVLIRSSCWITNVEKCICRWPSYCLLTAENQNDEILESLSICDTINLGVPGNKSRKEQIDVGALELPQDGVTKAYNYQPS